MKLGLGFLLCILFCNSCFTKDITKRIANYSADYLLNNLDSFKSIRAINLFREGKGQHVYVIYTQNQTPESDIRNTAGMDTLKYLAAGLSKKAVKYHVIKLYGAEKHEAQFNQGKDVDIVISVSAPTLHKERYYDHVILYNKNSEWRCDFLFVFDKQGVLLLQLFAQGFS